MLKEMTSTQYQEWKWYFEHNPWGSQIEWLQVAMLCAVIASTAPRKKGAKRPKVKDFLPKFGAPSGKAIAPEVLKAKTLHFLTAFGAEIPSHLLEAEA